MTTRDILLCDVLICAADICLANNPDVPLGCELSEAAQAHTGLAYDVEVSASQTSRVVLLAFDELEREGYVEHDDVSRADRLHKGLACLRAARRIEETRGVLR